MAIIVLVNLLIAMMSKTHDAVVEHDVREREWTYHMTNVWVKFIRRDFVAPIPVCLLPNIYRHCFDPNSRIMFRRSTSKVVNDSLSECGEEFISGTNDDGEDFDSRQSSRIGGTINLSPNEIKVRNKK